MLFSDLSPLEQWVAHEEGYKRELHLCPTGFLSIGLGYNIEAHVQSVNVQTMIRWAKEGCPHQEAVNLMRNELKTLRRALMRYEWFAWLSPARQSALECMVYQLGLEGTLAFSRMMRALRVRDYAAAAVEMLDSKWAQADSPTRAGRVAQVMQTGVAVEFAGTPAGW